mmetsp:Transcript_11587/g.17532  ORF Transcript_11587/g.17532 Transcript_11587/m.17532 type:complete len:355 (-) Transcript_11587:165-1229(-)|eukprot:CAMPEP_0170496546 /NCGR_PEP_ID=MMETSP0208-20121228/22046_1 /TAXON_ID=197538 /ORGANISM="Strombidium inclinatum, Strain S3" /LENGTH=354 /DNA_ID=CAMNT_0010773127 /DNA_START=520 /DNA_END=1584 /DNA_ORIENTATION=-
MVRAINDNVASIIYNHYNDLEKFFWVGQYICFFSLACAILLTSIHSHFIEKKPGFMGSSSAPSKPAATPKKDEGSTTISKEGAGKKGSKLKKALPKFLIKKIDSGNVMPFECWIVVFIYTIGYSTIHSFYPNMSKFLQQNYGLTNSHAGHLSSIPYIFSSFAVPLFGHLLSYFGEGSYEMFLGVSNIAVFACQAMFLGIIEFHNGGHLFGAPKAEVGPAKEMSLILISIPILSLGVGHAMQATLQGPIVNKIVGSNNPAIIPQVFSTMKIFEGLILSISMYLNGHIRQLTGSYFGVSLLILVNSSIGVGLCIYLRQLIDSKENYDPESAVTQGGGPPNSKDRSFYYQSVKNEAD